MESAEEIRALTRLFKVLGDETRLRLVRLLIDQGPEGGLCVGALAARLGVSQSAVSQHLAVLRAAGLVVDQRRGYFVHYRLNRGQLQRWRAQVQVSLGEGLIRLDAG